MKKDHLKITVSVPISPKKREAMELYNENFLSELRGVLQHTAEKTIEKIYTRSVPKEVKEYVKRLDDRTESYTEPRENAESAF